MVISIFFKQLMYIPILYTQQKNILYGSVLKLSTILRYLPSYFDFEDHQNTLSDKSQSEASPKNLKRQKLNQKEDQFAQLLKPLNIQDCDFSSFPDPDIAEKTQKQYTSLKAKQEQSFTKQIDGEYFIDNTAILYELRNLNVIDVSDIDIVLIGQHLIHELVSLNEKRNMTKDLGNKDYKNYFKEDKMREIFAKFGIEEWQELYSHEDTNLCFEEFVKVLNYNESYVIDNLIKLTPLSSGLHLGSCNWIVEVGQQRFGLLSNSSEEGDFRYPLYFDSDALANLDVLLVQSIARQSSSLSYNNQVKSLIENLQKSLSSSLNSKVLLPVQSTFLLDIVDILIHKVIDRTRIIFISESSNQVIQYSNINVEYLNQKLQNKIFSSENPFSYEKLFKEGRMLVFNNIQQYLEYKKERLGQYQGGSFGMVEEFSSELIITTSPNLRMGDSVYWLHNFNKMQSHNKYVYLLLTDPYYANNDLLMKPYRYCNKVNVIYCPIDPNLTFTQINKLIPKLQPKRVICPTSYVKLPNASMIDTKITNETLNISEQSNIVIDSIQAGQVISLSEVELGDLKYKGTCPVAIAHQIKQKIKSQQKLSKLKGIEINFMDNQYSVVSIDKQKKAEQQGFNPSKNFYFKLLDIKNQQQAIIDGDDNQMQNNKLIKIKNDISLENCMNQIRVILAQNSLKNEGRQDQNNINIKLSEYECEINIKTDQRVIDVKCQENFTVLKKVCEIIKNALKLI